MKKTYKFKAGNKVRFTNEAMHRECPSHYPPVGTVGKVYSLSFGGTSVFVKWPDGSTSEDDRWIALLEDIELVEEE